MYDVEKIGQVVAERRRKMGLTQEALAARLHISPQAISKWETGGGYPDLSLIPVLAGALQITPGELFGSDGGDVIVAESFEGLPLVSSRGDSALYSSKEVLRKEDGIVYFTDGSEANLFSRTAVNMGPGEIRIVQLDRVYSEPPMQEMCPEKSTFSGIRSIEISMGMQCCIRLLRGEGDITDVEAKGVPRFLNCLRMYVSGETLCIECKTADGNSGGGDNSLTLRCGFAVGEHLRLYINGSGSASVEPDFAVGDIHINGSGNVDAANLDSCSLHINGSGDIQIGEAKKNLDVQINGSGDVSCAAAGNASIKINGSGDADIGKCSGSLSMKVAGSGDVRASGEVDTLNVQISGSGDLEGAELTASDAEFHISGNAGVTVGRIVRRSVEQIGKGCDLNVLRRG